MSNGKKWISKAIERPGALHRALGVPEGENIPDEKIEKAAKAGGRLGKMARFALVLRKFRRAKKRKDESVTVDDLIKVTLLDS